MDMFTFQILLPTLENAPEIRNVAFHHSLQIDLALMLQHLQLGLALYARQGLCQPNWLLAFLNFTAAVFSCVLEKYNGILFEESKRQL